MSELLRDVEGGGSNEYLRKRGARNAKRLLEAGLYQQLEYTHRTLFSRESEKSARFEAFGRDLGRLTTISASILNFGRTTHKPDPDHKMRWIIEISQAQGVSRAALVWASDGFTNEMARQHNTPDLWVVGAPGAGADRVAHDPRALTRRRPLPWQRARRVSRHRDVAQAPVAPRGGPVHSAARSAWTPRPTGARAPPSTCASCRSRCRSASPGATGGRSRARPRSSRRASCWGRTSRRCARSSLLRRTGNVSRATTVLLSLRLRRVRGAGGACSAGRSRPRSTGRCCCRSVAMLTGGPRLALPWLALCLAEYAVGVLAAAARHRVREPDAARTPHAALGEQHLVHQHAVSDLRADLRAREERHLAHAARRQRRARARARLGRGGQPQQERLPREREPRDPHAADRDPRLRASCSCARPSRARSRRARSRRCTRSAATASTCSRSSTTSSTCRRSPPGRFDVERAPVAPVALVSEVVALMSMRAQAKGLRARGRVRAAAAGDVRDRPAAAAPGAGEPDRQRAQVHRRGAGRAARRAARGAERAARALRDRATPASASARSRWSGCSSRSRRPTLRRRAATAARGWGCRSASTWSSCSTARSARRAGRARAARSGSSYPLEPRETKLRPDV